MVALNNKSPTEILIQKSACMQIIGGIFYDISSCYSKYTVTLFEPLTLKNRTLTVTLVNPIYNNVMVDY